MNRLTEVNIAGTIYPLNFSVKALCSLGREYGGGAKEILNALLPPGGESLVSENCTSAVSRIGAVLSESGAEYRRVFDGVEAPVLSESAIALLGIPEYVRLHSAIVAAITASSAREIEAETSLKNAGATQGG